MRNVIKSPKITMDDTSAVISAKLTDKRFFDADGTESFVKASDAEKRIETLKLEHEQEIEKIKNDYVTYYETQIRNLEDERTSFMVKASENSEKEMEKTKILAKQYLDETEKICEDNLMKATQEGLQKGYNDGLEKATAENQMVLFQLKNVIEGIGNSEKDIMEQYETEFVDFAVDLASKIIATEIRASDKAVINLVADTIKKLKDFKRVTIYLAGFDVSVSTLASELVARRLVEYEEYITVEFLDNAEDGTCIVETDNEILDTSVYDQIKNLSKRLRESN